MDVTRTGDGQSRDRVDRVVGVGGQQVDERVAAPVNWNTSTDPKTAPSSSCIARALTLMGTRWPSL